MNQTSVKDKGLSVMKQRPDVPVDYAACRLDVG
jgi:hypothetical protein